MTISKDDKPISPPGGEEDFSASMARLAELAAQGISEKKPKDDATSAFEDETLKEFLKPKRKAKPASWKERFAGQTIKLKINPYVASGVLVIFLAAVFLLTPQIIKYMEEKRLARERKEAEAAMIAATTEKKLKTYSVFDAAKDVGGNGELKTSTIDQLAKDVAAANEAAIKLEEEHAIQLAMQNEEYEIKEVPAQFFAEEFVPAASVPSTTGILPEPSLNWEGLEITTRENASFDFSAACTKSVDSAATQSSIDQAALFSDAMRRFVSWPTSDCAAILN